VNRQKRAAERRKRKYANWLDDACATGDPKYAAGALVRYIGRGPTNGKLADVTGPGSTRLGGVTGAANCAFTRTSWSARRLWRRLANWLILLIRGRGRTLA